MVNNSRRSPSLSGPRDSYLSESTLSSYSQKGPHPREFIPQTPQIPRTPQAYAQAVAGPSPPIDDVPELIGERRRNRPGKNSSWNNGALHTSPARRWDARDAARMVPNHYAMQSGNYSVDGAARALADQELLVPFSEGPKVKYLTTQGVPKTRNVRSGTGQDLMMATQAHEYAIRLLAYRKWRLRDEILKLGQRLQTLRRYKTAHATQAKRRNRASGKRDIKAAYKVVIKAAKAAYAKVKKALSEVEKKRRRLRNDAKKASKRSRSRRHKARSMLAYETGSRRGYGAGSTFGSEAGSTLGSEAGSTLGYEAGPYASMNGFGAMQPLNPIGPMGPMGPMGHRGGGYPSPMFPSHMAGLQGMPYSPYPPTPLSPYAGSVYEGAMSTRGRKSGRRGGRSRWRI